MGLAILCVAVGLTILTASKAMPSAYRYKFAGPRGLEVNIITSQQDLRVITCSKRQPPSRPRSPGPTTLYRAYNKALLPHKAKLLQLEGAPTEAKQLLINPPKPPDLKGILKMPSRNDTSRTPKKQVRFNDIAKTESDRVWVGRTPKKTAELKHRSSRRGQLSTPRQKDSSSRKVYVAAAGLSAAAAALNNRRPHRSSKPQTPRRRDRVAQPATPRTPRRREERPRKEERGAKQPKIVYGQKDLPEGCDWVRVVRRHTRVYNL